MITSDVNQFFSRYGTRGKTMPFIETGTSNRLIG